MSEVQAAQHQHARVGLRPDVRLPRLPGDQRHFAEHVAAAEQDGGAGLLFSLDPFDEIELAGHEGIVHGRGGRMDRWSFCASVTGR